MIVLYDGDCGFCRWTIAWALRRNPALEVAPIQSELGARLLADLEPAERLRTVHVVHDSRRESGGAAMRAVLDTLPSARPLARLANLSPRLTERAYRLVADHRGFLGRFLSKPGDP